MARGKLLAAQAAWVLEKEAEKEVGVVDALIADAFGRCCDESRGDDKGLYEDLGIFTSR